jgi:hypothetical protein
MARSSRYTTRWRSRVVRANELADEKKVSDYAKDLRETLSEGTLAERRAFIRTFVKEVKVTGNDVVMTYTNPILPGGRIEEKVPVLCIEHYGGRYRTRTCDLTDVNRVL